MVANATMSARSFRRHRFRWSPTRRTIPTTHRIFAQDAEAAERFRLLGVPGEAVEVVGSLKLAPGPSSQGELDQGSRGETVTFGSIHADEVAQLAPVFRSLLEARPAARIFLAPRHPDRFTAESVRALCGPDVAFAASLNAIPSTGRLVWVNAMGMLDALYGRSRLGVVCGTFNEVGGHDLAEPFHMGAVAIYGPNVTRQRALHATLAKAGCAVQVAGPEALSATILEYLCDGSLARARLEAFARAVAVAEENLDRVASEVREAAGIHPTVVEAADGRQG
jgi:3-deoxy-D-manno-octulosonic-acid transferase